MKKFRFTAMVTVSAFTDVVAETEEAARAIAEARRTDLRNSFGDEEAREVWLITEADGEAQDIECAYYEDTDEEEADEE